MLKGRLITGDDFSWKLPATTSMEERKEEQEEEMLRYVGGVDVSFSKEDPSVACGSLVVLDIQNFQVVYDDYAVVTLRVPYVPGFLAFREVFLLPITTFPLSNSVVDLLSVAFDVVLFVLRLRFFYSFCRE